MRGFGILGIFLLACGGDPVGGVDLAPAPNFAPPDLAPADPTLGLAPAPLPDLGEAADLARPQCQWGGAPGSCMSASACGAIADHTAESSTVCGGQTCCIVTPNVADNPAIPSGYKLMMQSQVTADMTNWAVMILHDPVTYPLWSTTTRTFGSQLVLARVEWHPPDFQNSIVHRGVTLYVPK
jgi:hypothetical protein